MTIASTFPTCAAIAGSPEVPAEEADVVAKGRRVGGGRREVVVDGDHRLDTWAVGEVEGVPGVDGPYRPEVGGAAQAKAPMRDVEDVELQGVQLRPRRRGRCEPPAQPPRHRGSGADDAV